jgi:hypothetical protein
MFVAFYLFQSSQGSSFMISKGGKPRGVQSRKSFIGKSVPAAQDVHARLQIDCNLSHGGDRDDGCHTANHTQTIVDDEIRRAFRCRHRACFVAMALALFLEPGWQ